MRPAAAAAGSAARLSTITHDMLQPLPLGDETVDAVYSHMLFTMALTTPQLEALSGEVRRVLRPGGLHVYTVRHVGDANYGVGINHGDDMFENGGLLSASSTAHSSTGSPMPSRWSM
ncbi:class I SAM-dependent methyltransferase [Micromonospora sp. NPDC005806]|uniref:class I SAM-dependent methyltransferase n=1 Tax=Micromonospora sp. NPDC005806 TaxID=3364234 RepID=UPI00369DF73C